MLDLQFLYYLQSLHHNQYVQENQSSHYLQSQHHPQYMKKISLLTVDAAGTLLKPWPSVGAVYGKAARKKGIQVDDTDLDTQFGKAFNEVQKIAHKNQNNYPEISKLMGSRSDDSLGGPIATIYI